MKDKNHIMSIDADDIWRKLAAFRNKMCFSMIKTVYGKPAADVTLDGEDENFSCEVWD